MKKYLLASSALVLATFAVNAQAIDAEFYGQVNKGIVWADNDDNATGDVIRFGDVDTNSTRFGFRGEQEVRPGLSASFLIEGELKDGDSTGSFDVAGDPTSAGASTFTERHARIGLTGNWGSVFLGRTSSATDGITEIDLSGVENLGSDLEKIGGGITFFNSAGAAAISGDNDTVANNWDNIEGFSQTDASDRVNLVRYDSPIFNGFQASIASANGGSWDTALRYGNKFGAFEVKAGLGYVNQNVGLAAAVNDDVTSWSGSVAVKHDSGWNGAFAYGRKDNDSSAIDDTKLMYVKAGYDTGNWGFGVDYGMSNQLGNVVNQVNDAESYGIAAQYNLGKGVQMGLSYRNVDASDGNGAANQRNDVDLLTAAMVVKF